MEINIQIKATPDKLRQILAFLEKDTEIPKTLGPIEDKPTPTKDKVTATDVRAIALKFTQEGRGKELKSVFQKYGAVKLSEIPEENLADAKAELNALLGGENR